MGDTPVMWIDGTPYAERPAPTGLPPTTTICDVCALWDSRERCAKAIDGAAAEAFGGDCDERDVIYVQHGAARRDGGGGG